MCIYIYVYIYIYIYTHTHIYTHVQSYIHGERERERGGYEKNQQRKLPSPLSCVSVSHDVHMCDMTDSYM